MGLFYRRPLSLFCFIFLAISFVFQDSSVLLEIICISIFAVLVIIFLVLSLIQNKSHVKLTTAFICFLVATFAVLHSFLFVGLPKAKAQSYIGSHKVSCIVIDKEYDNSSSDTYCVIIDNIDGESVSIRADLKCYFNSDFKSGDNVYARMEISDNVSTFSQSKGRLLSLQVNSIEGCFVRHTSERPVIDTLFSKGGVEILSNKLGNFLENILIFNFGVEKGSLAMGLLTGERGSLPIDIKRDFRRSGLSHLMAVSGSHIAILLGAVDIFLRKLYVDKKYRCIVVSIFSIAFLFVSGFSLSGCRSVFMLYSVYLSFLFYEDNDSITALFVSVVLIVLISPHSISDLGLIMSFLATLGLLTMYPAIEGKLPYPRKGKKLIRRLLIVLRQGLLIVLMTVVANAFLLPISWWFFGEISIVSLISNLLVSPLVSAFMILIPAFLLVCNIPFISSVAAFIVSGLADIILFIVRACSKLPSATVSLKYGFCTVIVLLFTVSMIVLLTVRLKKKHLILLPTVCAVVSYAICFGVSAAFVFKPEITYIRKGGDEMLFIHDGVDFSVCDISDSDYFSYNHVIAEHENSNATEIKAYVLSHYNDNAVDTLELITNEIVVRKIYAPVPKNDEDRKTASRLVEMDADIQFYNRDSKIGLCSDVTLNAVTSDDHDKGCFFAFVGKDTCTIYTSEYYLKYDFPYDHLIKGVHFGKAFEDTSVEYKIPLTDN